MQFAGVEVHKMSLNNDLMFRLNEQPDFGTDQLALKLWPRAQRGEKMKTTNMMFLICNRSYCRSPIVIFD